MRMVLTSAPVAEPLNAADIRARLGIGADVTDDVLNAYVAAARQQLDGWVGWLHRALITQTWTMHLPAFSRRVRIPLPPLQSVVSVTYTDAAGAEQTVAGSNYRTLPGNPPTLVFADSFGFPGTECREDAVRITFKAGYGDAGTDVPEPIRQAITLMVRHIHSIAARDLFLSEETVDGIGAEKYVVGSGAGIAINGAVASLLSIYKAGL